MRYIILTISIFCIMNTTSAQTYEAGIMLGGLNYVGDVGSSSFMKPGDYLSSQKIAFGGIFKWNRSPRHSFRFSLLRGETFANDNNAEDGRRSNRRFKFETEITELSAGLEYTFWEWNLHDSKRPQITPYLYTGITYFFSNEFFEEGGQLKKGDEISNFSLPMVVGIKGTISRKLILALEFGARYTFTDNLDGSASEEISSQTNYPTFGNSNMNDWYIFSGLTLTYTFGRRPCYCKF